MSNRSPSKFPTALALSLQVRLRARQVGSPVGLLRLAASTPTAVMEPVAGSFALRIRFPTLPHCHTPGFTSGSSTTPLRTHFCWEASRVPSKSSTPTRLVQRLGLWCQRVSLYRSALVAAPPSRPSVQYLNLPALGCSLGC